MNEPPISEAAASPARAGMDRCSGLRHRASARFPRTRGDGPGAIQINAEGGVLPPHARGWTGKLIAVVQRGQASPARAGMDLSLFMPPFTSRGFPRTRGDGPQ